MVEGASDGGDGGDGGEDVSVGELELIARVEEGLAALGPLKGGAEALVSGSWLMEQVRSRVKLSVEKQRE